MTLNRLVERIEEGAEVLLAWSVLPDIGPDWIGGGRTVTVRVDAELLAEDTPAAQALIAALVATMNLPAASPITALRGAGALELRGEWLVLDFEWTNAAPYQDGDGDVGDVRLMRRP